MTDIPTPPVAAAPSAAMEAAAGPIVFGRGPIPALDLRWLLGLLALDLALIAVHVALGATLPTIPPAFNIAFDHSLGEQLNYAKWAAVVAALAITARTRRAPVLLAMAAAFLLVFLDDSMQIHETLGHAIADGSLLAGLGLAGSQDLGELAVMGGYAVLLSLVLALGFLASDKAARRDSVRLVALLLLLAVFAVGIDQAHGVFRGLPYGIQIADLLEDGGEMLVASLIVAHAVALMRTAQAR